MKYVIMILVSLLITGITKAQSFSINTDGSSADNSAILDVKSTNRGMLIPRMTKAQRNVIAAPATGLIVFQLSPDSTGFYYFNGTAWTWLPGNDVLDTLSWKRHGNIATNPAIHFIGTVDDQPLSFRQNNKWLGRWDATKNNYFIGDSAGARTTTATNNIAIGDSALRLLSFGGRNIAIGRNTLAAATSVSGLIAIGDSAGALKTNAGDKNIYIGEKAGRNNQTGTANIFIGTNAGSRMLGGEGNIFIGDSTGASIVNHGGTSSVFIGDRAGSRTVYTASNHANTFIGNYSGRLNTSGRYNTFLGTASGWENTTGSFNTFIGEFLALQNTTGEKNFFGGYQSGYFSNGNDNVFLGYQSGSSNTSGSGNTVLGSDANVLKNNLNNATAIGFRAAVDTSNALILGSIAGINSATSHTNVGIGTTKPLAMLHVKDSNVLFTAPASLPFPAGNPPVSGAGNRMMWYAEKAAFRAGGAAFDEWDNFNVGYYSGAFGYNNKAIGYISFTTGYQNTVSGNYTTALGHLNNVSGETGTAIGYFNTVSGSHSVAIGVQNTSSGTNSISIGSANSSSGVASIALGNFTNAIGGRSTTMGFNTKAKPFASVVIGQFNDTTSINSLNWDPLDPVFVIGNGTSSNRRNAFIITKEGETGINIANGLPQALLHLKAKEATYDMHIRLENVSNTDYASLVYDGSLKFRTFGANDEYQWRNAANSTSMRLTNDGELGINTAAPQALLDAGGTFKLGANGSVNNAIMRDTIAIPAMVFPGNGEVDISVAIANINSNAVVSLSPSGDIPNGIVISWVRAFVGGFKVRFRNVTGAIINVPAMNFYYSVVQ